MTTCSRRSRKASAGPAAARTCLAAAALALGGCNLLQQWRPDSVATYRPVFEQAARGDVAAVTAALDREPRLIRAREEDRQTLLHEAAGEGMLKMATTLIDRGARIDARTGGGLTPLHLAAQNGDVPMIELLVRQGAAINAKDSAGRTPLDQATAHEHASAAARLRALGARVGREG